MVADKDKIAVGRQDGSPEEVVHPPQTSSTDGGTALPELHEAGDENAQPR